MNIVTCAGDFQESSEIDISISARFGLKLYPLPWTNSETNKYRENKFQNRT